MAPRPGSPTVQLDFGSGGSVPSASPNRAARRERLADEVPLAPGVSDTVQLDRQPLYSKRLRAAAAAELEFFEGKHAGAPEFFRGKYFDVELGISMLQRQYDMASLFLEMVLYLVYMVLFLSFLG